MFVNSIYTVYGVLTEQSQIACFQNLNLCLVNVSNFETFLIIKKITHRNVNTSGRETVNL